MALSKRILITFEAEARVVVLDGNRKGELGTVTGHGPNGTPLVKLDSLAFSQPGLTVEPVLSHVEAAVLAFTPAPEIQTIEQIRLGLDDVGNGLEKAT